MSSSVALSMRERYFAFVHFLHAIFWFLFRKLFCWLFEFPHPCICINYRFHRIMVMESSTPMGSVLVEVFTFSFCLREWLRTDPFSQHFNAACNCSYKFQWTMCATSTYEQRTHSRLLEEIVGRPWCPLGIGAPSGVWSRHLCWISSLFGQEVHHCLSLHADEPWCNETCWPYIWYVHCSF